MHASRCPHRVVHTLQDGRVYILDTGQKVHFERLKRHNSGPLEFVATPLDTGDVAVVMDPEPEHSIEPINDDCSKLSFKSEQLLSKASNASLPSRQRHWMDTRCDCAQSCAREEPDCITSNSTTPLPKQKKRRITRCSPSLPTPHNKFTPNPILKQSPTHRHLTFYQMYRCSAVSHNYFPIITQCAHLHHTFHSQVKLRSYPQWVPMLRC